MEESKKVWAEAAKRDKEESLKIQSAKEEAEKELLKIKDQILESSANAKRLAYQEAESLKKAKEEMEIKICQGFATNPRHQEMETCPAAKSSKEETTLGAKYLTAVTVILSILTFSSSP